MASGSCSCTRVPVLIVSSVVVIKDNGMDSKSLWLSFVSPTVLIVIVAALQLPTVSSYEESEYATHGSCSCDSLKCRCC